MEKKIKNRVIPRLWTILSLTSLVVNGKATTLKKRVCVIGAGASGLTSLKHLADNLDKFEPVVFEKKLEVGGQWLYTDDVNNDQFGMPVQSSVYKHLRTNGPKEIIAFPDYPHFSSSEQRSCVRHEEVLQYLENYTNHYNLRQYIRFDTLVEHVIPQNLTSDKTDWRQSKWLIMARKGNTNIRYEVICDAVMVCNGAESKPFIPNIPGIENFPGRVLHSHVYRNPEEFVGQTILLLGAKSSAVDLAIELSSHSKTIYLSHRHKNSQGFVSQRYSELILQDVSKILVDTFIFCTGYVQDMPFLTPNSGVQVYDKSIDHLYMFNVNVGRPSMGFIGVGGLEILTFARFYLQAQYYVAVLEGKINLPSRLKMLQDQLNLSHDKNYTEWEYYADLANVGNLRPLPSFYENGIKRWLIVNLNDRIHFKEYNMRIANNGEIEIMKPSTALKK